MAAKNPAPPASTNSAVSVSGIIPPAAIRTQREDRCLSILAGSWRGTGPPGRGLGGAGLPLDPWGGHVAVIPGNYKQPRKRGGEYVAGLGCVDGLGTPAWRRNNSERDRWTDARAPRRVGGPRIAIGP